MARLRKFKAYQRLERPYTRISKYNKKNFVRGGYPHMKVIKFDMGNIKGEFDTVLRLNSTRAMNVRHNALEAARITSNKMLDTRIPKNYHLKIKTYPFHILRENPLASGAGADRMSTGMKKSFKKTIPNCQMDHLNLILHDLRMICFSLSKSTLAQKAPIKKPRIVDPRTGRDLNEKTRNSRLNQIASLPPEKAQEYY